MHLAQLWAAFCQQHPRCFECFAHRDTFMKTAGEHILVPVKNEPKMGRNDPCPCGSGRKYKKCCGS
ncbi:SEC-C metal-binding domain-containing protein [Robbsia andropogonis]|uniref:SEC-C metal-binding domain-containing protein n=1 Tax=Robbsia andropogonis TaxID=28092 RepID=UPI002A6A46E9|nr:SEC-C metal-binding domain-containing protein [Robbsia andropogonis]